MGETDLKQRGAPPVTGQPSGAAKGTTSAPPEATYTKDQLGKHTSDALTEQGRKHKEALGSVTAERDDLLAKQVESIALQRQIDELTSKDPEVYNLAKKERELISERAALTKDTKFQADRILKADKIERAEAIKLIAGEFEGGDAEKLITLCETFGTFEKDKIREGAATLWAKKFVEPAPTTTPAAPYSGMTSGGTEDLSKLSSDDKIMKGLKL